MKQLKIVGHRGARGLAHENTILSLKKALEHHLDEIEFDLRVTKDEIVVLHHDPEIIDADSQKMSIADHDYKELLLHMPDLATFDQALIEINRKVPMLIEVKPGVDINPVVAIIDKFLADKGKTTDLVLASFSQKTLLELHTALPQIKKAVNESWSGTRAAYRAKALGTNRVSMNQRWLWRGFIGPVSRRGWELYAYTLNNPKKARRWAKYGLSGAITDFPERFEL
jgi:glycerophosphoryl diester phosphodiesterase